MMNYSKVLVSLLVVGASTLYSADLPKELNGNYVTKGNAASCTTMADLTITKNYFSFGTVSGCEVKKAKNVSKDSYSLDMLCASEGDEFKSTSKLKILNNGIVVDDTFYESCKRIASTKTCIVPQGNAGVTTFLDKQLKKQGATVRDFDGYVFKATDKIKVGKEDILVGQLFMDEKMVESTSYAYAEEWECK